jgi:hypothetical protein
LRGCEAGDADVSGTGGLSSFEEELGLLGLEPTRQRRASAVEKSLQRAADERADSIDALVKGLYDRGHLNALLGAHRADGYESGYESGHAAGYGEGRECGYREGLTDRFERTPCKSEAIEFLLQLPRGAILSAELFERAKAAGIYKSTLKRALKDLGVKSAPSRAGGAWEYRLSKLTK